VVLGAMALYHLWQLRADLRVIHTRTPAAPPVSTAESGASAASDTLPEQIAAPSDAETLELILQRVYAGALDPASAARRIRSLPKL
jgi:hypothetical protein